jgi:lipopolysaccharide/colanic/teichoic acid biosynthesis glycosyltransferase
VTGLVDVAAASLLLLLTAPAAGAVCLALRLEGRLPVFWRSRRLGRGGRPFRLLAFRTMVDDGRSPEGRLTAAGHVVRRSSLDHLPMLVNVLRGDLSLVGPRPTEPGRVDPADPAWGRLVTVRPGLESYALLRLGRTSNPGPMALRQRLGLEYLARRSLRLDLRLCGVAVAALVVSRGNVKARGRLSPEP